MSVHFPRRSRAWRRPGADSRDHDWHLAMADRLVVDDPDLFRTTCRVHLAAQRRSRIPVAVPIIGRALLAWYPTTVAAGC